MAADIRVMIPRVRRALEGTGAPVLTDDQLKDIVADAASAIVLYTGSLFGHQLTVSEVDPDTGAPSEYETDEALTLAEQTVVAAQAALDFFFFTFSSTKTSESISDEGSSWSYAISAQLLRDRMKFLQDARDKALDSIAAADAASLDTYTSFLAVRDTEASRAVEPWVHGHSDGGGGAGGQEFDPRFDW